MAKQEKKYAQDIEDLFQNTDRSFEGDDVEQELDVPIVDINMTQINQDSERVATLITERLSGYYFSQEYIDEHPYIPTKIMLVMNNVRRNLKMLSVNERAQDALILGVSYNAGKGSLYGSLTALQNAMLNIQMQLNKYIEELEEIFQKMQDECEKTFKEKDIEKQSDGSFTVRGAKELIQQIQQMQQSGKINSDITIDERPIESKSAEELDAEISLDDLVIKK